MVVMSGYNTKLRIIPVKFLYLLLEEIIYFWTFIANNCMKRFSEDGLSLELWETFEISSQLYDL